MRKSTTAVISVSPRAARTRAALLQAGMDLLAKRPVDAIAIDELVAVAGVAKGSFFNHFTDKNVLAAAIAVSIRGDIEARVAQANAGLSDPLARLSGGMIVAAAFALSEPKRFAALARTASGTTLNDHALNTGVADDLRQCLRANLIRPEAQRCGVAFWLGCCQTLMIAIVEQRASIDRALELLTDMLGLSLAGLGAKESAARRLTERASLLGKLQASMTPSVTTRTSQRPKLRAAQPKR